MPEWWDLVSDAWDRVSPHADARALSAQLAEHPEHVRHLWAATWFDCELNNGGLYQFLWNIPMVCPHAVEGLRVVGFLRAAEALAAAEKLVGGPFADPEDAREALERGGFDFVEARIRALEDAIAADVFDIDGNLDRFRPAMVWYAARFRRI